MAYEKSVSFRTHIQSNTFDILNDAKIDCIHTLKLVISLVSQLAAYTEEGVPLSPSVFICNSISSLVRMAGAGEFVILSENEVTATAAGKILKAGAPLCTGSWRIYVERIDDGERCRFGVFCGSSDPSSFTVDEVLLEVSDEKFPIIRIAQNVTNKVEVRTSAGSGIEFRFNDDNDVAQLDNRSNILQLASAVAADVSEDSESFKNFIERVLSAAIRESHGTLVAVVSGKDGIMPNVLTDGLTLNPPLDLYDRYQLHFKEEKTAVSVSRLQAASELLAGFVNSDGITVLNSGGKVLGYRAFIRSPQPDSPSTGGARTRAYAALSALVGNGLDAAFFRSQDGRMELKIAREDGQDA